MSDPLAFRVMNEIGIIDQLGSTLFERSMPFGLTLPQFVVLNHFVRVGGHRSPVELASAIQVTKATMTSTLQRLERKGFVTSEPDERMDARSASRSRHQVARPAINPSRRSSTIWRPWKRRSARSNWRRCFPCSPRCGRFLIDSGMVIEVELALTRLRRETT